MIYIIMIKEVINIYYIYIYIDQIVKIGEYHSVVEYNKDRIIEIVLGITRTIEIISGEDILEGI